MEFVHEEDRERILAGVARTIAGFVEPHEFRVLDKGGRMRFVRTSGRPIVEDGQLVGIAGVLSDLTDLRQAEAAKEELEAQLQQSQKMEALGRLAGGVAHDFNNLLFVILNYATLLEARSDPDSKEQQQAGAIRQAAERAAALTRQLLTFSRTKVMKPRRLHLNEVLVETESMLRRIVGEDVQLSTRLGKGLPRIACDRAHLDQVLINLTVNAREAMGEGGVLSVETGLQELGPDPALAELELEPGSYVCLAVEDTGCGMSRAVQERACEPFFTTKKGSGGTGLGLSTVYSAVRQAGGLLRLHSEPGRGTRVEVFLPAAQELEALEADEDCQEAPPSSQPVLGQGRVALLVEDEPRVRELARTMLEAQDFVVLDAGHPEQALRLARLHRAPLALLLTDVVMPDINGRQLAEELRSMQPDLPVLYMSGYTDNVISRHGMLEDDVVLLEKPFTSEDLRIKVAEVLGACAGQDSQEEGEGA